MRIALVVTGGVDRSGRENVIPILLTLIERLARRHDVTVYVLRYHATPTTYPLLGATVRDLGRPTGACRQYRRLVSALAQDGPVDVIHGYWALPGGLVAAAAGRRLGVPVVVTCNSGEFVGIPDIAYGSQLRLRQRAAVAATTRMAHRVTVDTQYQADLARRLGVSTEIVPLGVDSKIFVPGVRLEGPPWRLLHVGSLNPVKDHATLLGAVQVLARRGIDVHLDCVGEDTMDGSAARLASERAVADRVTFYGFRPTAALVPFYQRSHVFVLSSRHEATGVVLLEAAACGVPIVGTAVGFIADWAGQAAVAVRPREPEQLADAIQALLADRPRRERLAGTARQWTLAHDADWTAAAFERVYAEAITPGS